MGVDARRIVSLLPAATEIACALGLGDRLVGISHECEEHGLPMVTAPAIDPSKSSAEIDRAVRSAVANGLSLFSIDVEKIRALAPDLVLTQDLCAVCAVSADDVEKACATIAPGARLTRLSAHSLDGLFEDIARVACAAGAPKRAVELTNALRARLASVRGRVEGRRVPRVACVEWLAPPMLSGGWIPELVRIAGGQPVKTVERFLEVSWSEIGALRPDVLVLFPCGFTIAKTLAELATDEELAHQIRALRLKTFVADGNALFNRGGPRLVESAETLAAVFHDLAYNGFAVAWP